MTESAVPSVLGGAPYDYNAIGTASPDTTIGSFANATRATLQTSAAWPLAKLVAYYPFSIAMPFTVKLIYWENGTTPVGNIEVGVYDEAGNRKITSTSTAAGTTAAIQTVTPTAVTLNGPARYYYAVTCDNVGGSYTLAMAASASVAGTTASLGVMTETTSVFGLTNPWGSLSMLTAYEISPNVGICNGTVM